MFHWRRYCSFLILFHLVHHFFFLSFPFTFFLLFFVLFCNFASSVCDCQFNEFPPCLPDKPLHRSQTPLHHHPLIVLMRHTHTHFVCTFGHIIFFIPNTQSASKWSEREEIERERESRHLKRSPKNLKRCLLHVSSSFFLQPNFLINFVPLILRDLHRGLLIWKILNLFFKISFFFWLCFCQSYQAEYIFGGNWFGRFGLSVPTITHTSLWHLGFCCFLLIYSVRECICLKFSILGTSTNCLVDWS